MIPRTLTSPLPIRGDVPGLLARGMPVHWRDEETPYVVSAPPFHDANDAMWLIAAPCAGVPIGVQDDPSNFAVDWSSPLAVYAALHWLSTRGHDCWWMRPAAAGGRTADWNEAAILVSVSVGRVVAGVGPVVDIARAYSIPTNARMSMDRIRGAAVYWTATVEDRDYFVAPTRLGPDVKATPDHPGWLYTPQGGLTSWGYEVGQAAVDRINACALADGAAFRVDGGVMVGVVDGA